MKKFKAESKRLLDLMIHSIYTNRDIFLRELISNASDAIDKRYVHILETDASKFDRSAFQIELIPNAQMRTLCVKDNGIGMTKEELEENLGTIAHSGTLQFRHENAETPQDAAQLIGQFGVGFYAAFMVADHVEVKTRSEKDEKGYLWKSDGSEGYTIEPIEKEEIGTEVCLHLKEDGEDQYSQYLDEYTLASLVERYSNYIRYPIRMEVIRHREVKAEGSEGDSETASENAEEKPKTEVYSEVRTLNSQTPIWEKSKRELTDEDYKTFYRQERFGFDEPLYWTHVVADGTLSYRAILFIPSKMPYDYYTKDFKKGLRLYSSGVKIMEQCEDLLPDYYGFIKGVVSSEDLSLNISREVLQQDRQLQAIARKLENKITDALRYLQREEREKYEQFYEAFGKALKYGIYQSYGMKADPLADLLIFETSQGKKRTLQEVVEAFSDTEEEKTPIYYVSGTSKEQIEKMPLMQGHKDKEVLYLLDEMDEFVLKMMQQYKEHPFRSIYEQEQDEDNAPLEGLYAKMKEILGDEVVAVRPSRQLQQDAVALLSQGEISIEMEKTFLRQETPMPMKALKVLEVNENHPIYAKLQHYFEEDAQKLEDYTKLLYAQARWMAGLPVDDPVEIVRKMQALMA